MNYCVLRQHNFFYLNTKLCATWVNLHFIYKIEFVVKNTERSSGGAYDSLKVWPWNIQRFIYKKFIVSWGIRIKKWKKIFQNEMVRNYVYVYIERMITYTSKHVKERKTLS